MSDNTDPNSIWNRPEHTKPIRGRYTPASGRGFDADPPPAYRPRNVTHGPQTPVYNEAQPRQTQSDGQQAQRQTRNVTIQVNGLTRVISQTTDVQQPSLRQSTTAPRRMGGQDRAAFQATGNHQLTSSYGTNAPRQIGGQNRTVSQYTGIPSLQNQAIDQPSEQSLQNKRKREYQSKRWDSANDSRSQSSKRRALSSHGPLPPQVVESNVEFPPAKYVDGPPRRPTRIPNDAVPEQLASGSKAAIPQRLSLQEPQVSSAIEQGDITSFNASTGMPDAGLTEITDGMQAAVSRSSHQTTSARQAQTPSTVVSTWPGSAEALRKLAARNEAQIREIMELRQENTRLRAGQEEKMQLRQENAQLRARLEQAEKTTQEYKDRHAFADAIVQRMVDTVAEDTPTQP